ncbi:hypothetical protein, conserved [Leishmania tarentolae]|uniref:Uncharacterized protein n=1 Tax=Leishmania tarentolae TaxID=5689 RepID=A0A640KR89_LEITA|nr:hypothetical protein, conserved [Leishmania tarentolae]
MAAAAGTTHPSDTALGSQNGSQRSAIVHRPVLEDSTRSAMFPFRDDSTMIMDTVTSAAHALSRNLLDQLQHDYPAVYEALKAYEKAARHLKSKYKAKEAELLRCISVGEELLSQMDVLKRRCEVLAQERDAAMAACVSAAASPRERAPTTGGTALSKSSWAEERRSLLKSHETECERYRIEVQKVLQDAAATQTQKRELELALKRTTAQLSEAEEQLRTAQDAISDCKAHYAAQQEKEMERYRAALAKQLSEVRQKADLDRETALSEAMIELERLQRALVRTQKELTEHQRASGSAQALQAELTCPADTEVASLQMQIRTLRETNHDLQQRLQRREAELQLSGAAKSTGVRRDDNQSSLTLASNSNRDVTLHGRTLTSSLVNVRPEFKGDAADASGLAAAKERLLEENARLRQKLQEVARRGQDDVDKEHAARLSLQQQMQTMEAQSHILRTEVVSRIQKELQQTKEQLEVFQAQSAMAERAAAELEMQTTSLQEEKATLADALSAEKSTTEKLFRELNAAEESQNALDQQLRDVSAAAQEKERLVVQLQREKGQLFNALRTLQAQAADIEVALTTVTTEQSESTAAHEGALSRLQDRCVLLEHEAEELRTERNALRCRLGDAEEAIDVLKDAQRVSQELVREAQRCTKTAEDRASVAIDQLTLQQQTSAVRLAEAQQQLERAHNQQRDLSRRMEVCQQELSRREEALRKSAEAQEELTAELERLREVQADRDENVRKRWRQQYAQSTLEREKLIAMKEAHVADLQRQQKDLQMSLAASEDHVAQLHEQRRQLQDALSDSLATAASHKGRIQALEEELARAVAEQRAAQSDLQRFSGEQERSSRAALSLQPSGECDALAAVRLAQLQGQLTEYEAAISAAEKSRQRMQSTVLGCLMPVDANGEVTADADNMWDVLLDLLREADQKLCSRSTSAASVQHRQVRPEEGILASDDRQPSDAASVPIDASLCAAAAVMRAIHDLVQHLHDADRRRWRCVRDKVLAACHAASAASDAAAPVDPAPAATENRAGASPEKLCADLASALQAWAVALSTSQDYLAASAAQIGKAAHLASKEEAQKAQLTQLAMAVRTAEEQRDALQVALEEMTVKYSEAAKRADAQESRVEALRHDVAVRDSRVREMEHRLEVRQTELQAERAEWVSKWQEAQRHREAEKKEAELEHAHLRAQVAAAEEAGHQSTQRAVQESTDALRQLRTQLQTLRETSSETEAQLRQQITQMSCEKVDTARALSRLKNVVAQLEERLNSTEMALKSREAELEAAMVAMQELKRVQLQRSADGAAAEAFEQRTLTEQVASLQAQLLSMQRDHDMQDTLHATERAEMAALRKVNASLEARLAEVEGDRAPLREQLHSLLSFTE